MKNTILLHLLFILLIPSISNAQFIHSYGLKLGYVKAEQRWAYSQLPNLGSGIKPIWGFDAGLFAEFLNFQNFSLLAEIHYIQKGRTLTIASVIFADNEQGYTDVGIIEIKQKFNYISIPILLKLQMNESTLTPYVAIGPSFEYLISYPPSQVYDKFNKTELAIKFAAGSELSLDLIPKMLIECRYNLGLTNTYKNEFVTVDNRVLEFIIGVVF